MSINAIALIRIDMAFIMGMILVKVIIIENFQDLFSYLRIMGIQVLKFATHLEEAQVLEWEPC